MTVAATPPLDFFARLAWLDGRPLEIEEYRREIFTKSLYTFDARGNPQYSMVLCGRAKKNYKTTDLVLAGFYRFLVWPSQQGNDIFIVANDEEQAADDLDLAKKLIRANPELAAEVEIKSKEIVRRDGRGRMKILPAQDAVGVHGKTFLMVGYDEIWGYRDYSLIEGLAPDPSRRDVLSWITSYAPLQNKIGVPLVDYIAAGKKGEDPRLFFSWYSGDYCSEPGLDDLAPEAKANPSAATWGDDGEYLLTQKRRLPVHRYRRLHLNLPGLQDGAAFDPEAVLSSVVTGRKRLPFVKDTSYVAFCDLSGGSADDACLGIAHYSEDDRRVITDVVVSQTGAPPFNPRHAVEKFVGLLKEYQIFRVTGDRYGGETFRRDFEERGITYEVSDLTTAEVYDAFEPKLNAGEVELLDIPKATEQLLGLVVRGAGKITHMPGDHDDFATALCGAVVFAERGHSDLGSWGLLLSESRRDAAAAQAAAERRIEAAASAERSRRIEVESRLDDTATEIWVQFSRPVGVAYVANRAFPASIQTFQYVPGISCIQRVVWQQHEKYLRGAGARPVNQQKEAA
ncbi:MAG TPA: hypothetical protein VGF34_15045 [Stellaceae bacterium]|jgi:hypothetical protein